MNALTERIAVLSDVHGNVTAYEAVLGDIERRGITRVLNLGDVVGKGPRGSECIAITRATCEVTVRGNWDAFIARDARQPWAGAQWTRDSLAADDLRWLGGLPNVHELVLAEMRVRLFHASPVSEFHRVYAPRSPAEFAAMLATTDFTGAGPVPSVVGHGDIHCTYLAVDRGVTVFNAGSVGNALDVPGAPYAVLEAAGGPARPGVLSVEFTRVPYDVEAEVGVACELGMPDVDAYAGELRHQRYRGSAQPFRA